MQKVVAILEKNVEWIALGLGVAFLGFMAWTYLLNPPVVAVIGTQRVTPGDVDDFILNGPVQNLKQKMADSQVPTFPVPDFSNLITQKLDPPPVKLTTLASIWDWQPSEVSSTISSPLNAGPKITLLPQLPAAQPLVFITGQSSIASPGASAPAQPAAPAPAAPAAPAPAANAGRTDVHWVTAAFSIPVAQLTAQWTAAFGPDKAGDSWKLTDVQRNTQFLEVTAYRSEQLPNGQWSPDQPVARLQNNPVEPLPTDPKNKVAERQFLLWASGNIGNIATPKFPDLAPAPAGSVWQDPAVAVQGLITAASAAAPPAPAGGAAPAPATPAANTDPSQQIIPFAPLPAVAPAAAANAVNFAPPAAGSPPGPDLLVYVNDLVAPGKTYRYSLSYKLKNPLFDQAPSHVKDPTWVDQLALAAPTSAYSPPVSIGPQTYFYCSVANVAGKAFPFDVFTWAAGLWQQHQFTVAPGDAIGGVVDGVDYSTGNTYVEGRALHQDYYVTVVDETGQASVRRAIADLNSPDHQARTQWVTQSKATTTPSGGNSGTDNSSGNGNNPSSDN